MHMKVYFLSHGDIYENGKVLHSQGSLSFKSKLQLEIQSEYLINTVYGNYG